MATMLSSVRAIMAAMLSSVRRIPYYRVLLHGLGVATCIVVFFAAIYVQNAAANAPQIVINEVLVRNFDVLADDRGEFQSIIELANLGAVAVNLAGWYLSDGDHRPLRWMIPQIVLQPGEFAVFFASGEDRIQNDGTWHTNFRLRRNGSEPVLLTMPCGTLIDRIPPHETWYNVSFGRVGDGGVLGYMPNATPGAENSLLYVLDFANIDRTPIQLYITQYMTRNDSFFPCDFGEYHDWVQLHNPNDFDVSLEGWFFTDRAHNLRRHRFSADTQIPAGGFLTYHMSGENRAGHLPFRLSANRDELILSNPFQQIVDQMPVYETPLFASFGRTPDGRMGFFGEPNPYGWSASEPADSWLNVAWHDRPTLRIMEYMTNNNFVNPDVEGDFTPWVEILNYGLAAIDLSEINLSDRMGRLDRWTFPHGLHIAPDERIIVFLSGKTHLHMHTPFRLSTTDDGLFISDRFGRIIDYTMPILRPPSHVSVGRCEDDPTRWLLFPRPTPGEPNDTVGFEEMGGVNTFGLRGIYISQVTPGDPRRQSIVHLRNITDDYMQTGGFGISTDRTNLFAETLPDMRIAPGATVRIDLGTLQLRPRGHTVFLTDPEGFLLDSFVTGTMRTGYSAARTYEVATPNGTGRVLVNTDGDIFLGFAAPVTFSYDSLHVEYGTLIEMHTAQPGGLIFFTKNGDPPTRYSQLYTEPVLITESVALRARVYAPDMAPGPILSRTFLVDAQHDLPIITLTTAHDGFFSHYYGIWADGPGWQPQFPHVGANFWWRGVERQVHFGFYEDGQLRVEADGSFRIHGSYSRGEPQKSLSVFFRSRYGVSTLAYPLIPGTGRYIWDSMILRTSGQDWRHSKLRDAFIHMAVMDDMNVTVQAARPVAVYINGMYWGLYNIREKINDDFFAINYGVPKDGIDIIRANSIVRAGSFDHHRAMLDALGTMQMNTPEAHAFVVEHIDLENWIDYWIIITFFGNTDTGNIRFYRFHDGGRWRWQLFDQDWALWPTTFESNPFFNMLNPEGHGVRNMFSTFLARRLMENDQIRNQFIERYAYLMRTTLHPERLISILDAYAAQIESEMPKQIARWRGPTSMAAWRNNLAVMRRNIEARPEMIRGFMRTTFGLSDERMEEVFGG